jgi:imidazolonepropionase-like amidohydrolase
MIKKRLIWMFCLGLLLSVQTATAQKTGSVLIKNATIITVTSDTHENADMLVIDGKIRQIGKNLSAPAGVQTIDASGKFVMPGIIDAHSHLAISGVNESSNPVTAEVTMEDVINPYDIGMYRALAGGVTAIHQLHGSANVIGGQSETIKLRYGLTAEELVMKGAPRTIKFALGENPTRVHGQGNGIQPRTRMGVEQVIRETFDAARDHKRHRDAYLAAKTEFDRNPRGKTEPAMVARNLRYEVINDILDGNILVHCHSYRADEILMLMRVFNDYGVKNYTFQHILEGFKVAPELAKNGAHASTFSDWWAYKFEVYYASAYNAAVMNSYGVNVSINSDSGELIRHLNHEAAKTMKYGNVSREDAIKMITINPAIQMGIDKMTGSLEVGKDADFAIWSSDPLSIYSICEKTFVDGVVYFDRVNDPDDMRLQISSTDTYDPANANESLIGRHIDSCMQDVWNLFEGSSMDFSSSFWHRGHFHLNFEER